MKKYAKTSKIVTAVALAVFGVGAVLGTAGLATTIGSIDESMVARTPEAVLASAGAEGDTDVSLPVSYFDQREDKCVNRHDKLASKALAERQFEWTECRYSNRKIEQGLVDYELGEDYLPVALGGKMDPNLGMTDMTRWYSEVKGKSKGYVDTLKLHYKQGEVAEFTYIDNDFYPLDGVAFSKGDKVNNDGHNHLFTMSFAVPVAVTTSGSEAFEITADDDTFVFLGDELILDMGGVHSATTGKLAIHENGEVYTGVESSDLAYSGMNVQEGDNLAIRIFHADRDSVESVFRVKFTGMTLNVVETQLASADGVQVAYDPNNPGYVAPLGETATFAPDVTKGQMIMATIMGVVVVVCAMFVTMLAHAMIKARR